MPSPSVSWWAAAAFLLAAIGASSPARILGLFPYKGASHFFTFSPLLEELARRGHSVDAVSHFPRSEPLANYTDISIGKEETHSFTEFSRFEKLETSAFSNMIGLKILAGGYEKALSNPRVLALVNSSYDLVITEMFNSDVFFGLAHRIGAPVVGFSSCQIMPWTADSIGDPLDLPYIPNSLGGGHGPEMGFMERLWNVVELWSARAFYRLVIDRDAQAMAERYLGPLPRLSDIAANTSLLLVNSHFTLLGHRPHLPSVVEVGGINVLPAKPLSQDLEELYTKAKGVIYFSMGSVLKGSSMSAEKQEMFLKAFAGTDRLVLWKREEPLLSHPNVITRPWYPQRDILAHPKTELFVSHCGLLGLNEAVTSGVPILCIPMFGDQPYNARHVEHSGIGKRLRFATLNQEELSKAINDLLNDHKYKSRAREVSEAFRDRPMPPLETAVYWTEYLLKHGPGHFQPPFKQLALWQKLGLDIAFALLAVLILVVSAAWFIFRIVCCRKQAGKKVKQS